MWCGAMENGHVHVLCMQTVQTCSFCGMSVMAWPLPLVLIDNKLLP